MRNSGQSDFDIFIDHTNTKIVIIPIIDLGILGRQSDVVMRPARRLAE